MTQAKKKKINNVMAELSSTSIALGVYEWVVAAYQAYLSVPKWMHNDRIESQKRPRLILFNFDCVSSYLINTKDPLTDKRLQKFLPPPPKILFDQTQDRGWIMDNRYQNTTPCWTRLAFKQHCPRRTLSLTTLECHVHLQNSQKQKNKPPNNSLRIYSDRP